MKQQPLNTTDTVIYHSPLGIDYTQEDLLRIDAAMKAAAKRMKSFGRTALQREPSQQEKLSLHQASLQRTYEKKCWIYREGMSVEEIRDTLSWSAKLVYKAYKEGRIHRRRLTTAKGGQYLYNAAEVFKILFERDYGFTPAQPFNNYNSYIYED